MHHILGDSFVNEDMALNYRAVLARPSISVTYDGVGSSSLPDQADRYAADPASWNRLLVINDGGPNHNAAQAASAMQDILDTCPHDYVLFLEPPYGEGFGFDNPTQRADHAAKAAAAKEVIGADRFVDTYEAFLAAAIGDPEDPGYAQDQADVANGLCPTSCRFDDIHVNGKGKTVSATEVRNRLIALGWIAPD